jgi:hypothetical protein
MLSRLKVSRPSRRPPLTVVAYVAIVVALIVGLAPGETHPGAPLAVLILLVASAGLLFGLGIAWLFLVVVEAGNLLVMVVGRQPWWALAVKAVMLALLVAPSTRRHLRWPRRRDIAVDSGP